MRIDDANSSLLGSRLRVRFSLKTVLLLVTILSVGLAYLVVHHRRSVKIEAWDRALRNVNCENIATVPIGTSVIHPSTPAASFPLQEQQLAELRSLTADNNTAIGKIEGVTCFGNMKPD